ncbi:hypothetical protein LP414_27560 [Polaromonas sp. P1(28)-13]|nr:hypothetical protein LP414_27560 [Polaromonas sp. P1(28)-13]
MSATKREKARLKGLNAVQKAHRVRKAEAVRKQAAHEMALALIQERHEEEELTRRELEAILRNMPETTSEAGAW